MDDARRSDKVRLEMPGTDATVNSGNDSLEFMLFAVGSALVIHLVGYLARSATASLRRRRDDVSKRP